MARKWTSGAESGATLSEGATFTATNSGAVTYDTGTVHLPGKRSYKFASGATAGTAFVAPTSGLSTASTKHVYSRAWVNFPTKAAACAFMSFHNGSSNVIFARFETNGTITLWNATGTPAQIGSGTATDMSNAWHRVELHAMVNSAGGSTGAADLWVDGTLIATTTTANFGTALINNARFGWCASTVLPGNNVNIFIDDIAVNDDSGSAQNGQVGNGYVLDLLPASDSAIGNWVEGTSATTSLWDAVNNQPPVGVAPTPANGTLDQIQNANSSTSDPGAAYDANMQSYTTGGVRTNDTISLAQVVATVGVSSAASQNATLTGVSNPAITASANQATGSAIAGTFPTNWLFIQSGQISYAPTPTFGTQPVVRIHKASAVTNQLDCCYLALRIDVAPVNLRQITTTVAVLQTKSRTVATTVATLLTSSRTVSTLVAALRTSGRTIATALAALQTRSRTISTTVATLRTASRAVTTAVASLSTRSRAISTAVATLQTRNRTVGTVVAAITSFQRTVATTVAALLTSARTVATQAAVLATQHRTITTVVATFLPPPPNPGTVGLTDTGIHSVGTTDFGIDTVGPTDHT